MRHRWIAIVIVAAIVVVAITKYGPADPVAAAKSAEAEYHSLCDQWAAAAERGADTSAIEKAIPEAHLRFLHEATKTKYIPNNALFLPTAFAAAGKLTLDDGTSCSFVIGGEDHSLDMWVWYRTDWTTDRLPGHGFAGTLTIPANEGVGKLTIGRAIRQGEGSKTVFRVPYTLDGVPGTVEFRVADWSVHPDRGTVDQGGGWHPGATNRPSPAPASQPAATQAVALPGDGDTTSRLYLAGIDSADDARRFLSQLQTACAAKNRAAVAALVRYPFKTYNAGKVRKTYKNQAALLADYDQLFTPAVLKAIAEQTYDDLFVRDQGAMIGDGEIWFDQRDGAIKIIAINAK